jgi:uncharacterized protein YyaL (SSP411 family)
MSDHSLYTNRLLYQKSPYLLQHAHNPVDWYPWGEEAFQVAKEEDKPIFLSIGYATCHWCHVMEKESFENVEVAQLMNQICVNIKVDREELPDIDSLYMEFAQGMMSGAAGWPLNVILTPNLQPFFAVTYLPSLSHQGLMGLVDLLQLISELWNSEGKQKILLQAEKVVSMFANNIHTKGEELPSSNQIIAAIEMFYKMADPIYGGIKGEPKFPVAYQSSFLMRYYLSSQDTRTLFLVERTLTMMQRGGIYDHLGGGFSRYSVDEKWLVPHFEKMLYDNAIISQAYLEAWKLTKEPLYREICQKTLEYILRDMTHPEGGFYSAEDADSEGHEGLFYTWTYQEIIDVLGTNCELFCQFYGITPEGNFEGRNILHTPLSLKEFAATHRLSEESLQHQFDTQRHQLWQKRKQRAHPLKDDKILSSWNGLMIYTLAEAGKTFLHEPYLQAACKAARFIKEHLWNNHILLRRWREEQAMFAGSLDEYAFMIRALISLFEANQGSEWLAWAIEMSDILTQSYKAAEGAFYQTDGLDPNLLFRRCQFSDGAEPSGNAIHAENLLRLHQLTHLSEYREQAEDVFKAVKEYLENYPPGYCYHLMNIHRYYDKKAATIIIALNTERQNEKELKEALSVKFYPYHVIIWQNQDIEQEELLPFTKEYIAEQNQTTLYICYQGRCLAPLKDLPAMLEALNKL